MYTRWKSAALFAPGLLEMHRLNNLYVATLQAERPLTQQTSLQLEWNGRRARDTIPLYTYRAQTLMVTVSYRF